MAASVIMHAHLTICPFCCTLSYLYVQGATSTANHESGSGGPALQLVESELDLKPSSNPLVKGDQREASSKASSANSGSQALQMTDNRFVFQPAFEERLRAAPERHAPKPRQLRADSGQGAAKPSQASSQVAKHGVKQVGHLQGLSKLGKTTAHTSSIPALQPVLAQHRSLSPLSAGAKATNCTTSQQSKIPLQPAAAHLVRSQQARPPSSSPVRMHRRKPSSAPGQALSTGRMQISPQPKPHATRKVSAQQEGSRSAAEPPAKRIKYDHLLGGNALLSLAGKHKKKS